MLGNGERVLVMGLRTVDAEVAGEVAEDMGYGPEGNQHRVGSGGPGGERQQRLVGGFGAVAVVESDGEQAANAGQEQPAAVPANGAEGGATARASAARPAVESPSARTALGTGQACAGHCPAR